MLIAISADFLNQREASIYLGDRSKLTRAEHLIVQMNTQDCKPKAYACTEAAYAFG